MFSWGCVEACRLRGRGPGPRRRSLIALGIGLMSASFSAAENISNAMITLKFSFYGRCPAYCHFASLLYLFVSTLHPMNPYFHSHFNVFTRTPNPALRASFILKVLCPRSCFHQFRPRLTQNLLFLNMIISRPTVMLLSSNVWSVECHSLNSEHDILQKFLATSSASGYSGWLECV